MLAPIVIRPGFITLLDFPVIKTFWKRSRIPLSDTDSLRHELGIHEECGNPLYFFRPGETHSLLVCIRCGLRIIIPSSLKTYGELRAHFAKPKEES